MDDGALVTQYDHIGMAVQLGRSRTLTPLAAACSCHQNYLNQVLVWIWRCSIMAAPSIISTATLFSSFAFAVTSSHNGLGSPRSDHVFGHHIILLHERQDGRSSNHWYSRRHGGE